MDILILEFLPCKWQLVWNMLIKIIVNNYYYYYYYYYYSDYYFLAFQRCTYRALHSDAKEDLQLSFFGSMNYGEN